MVVAWYGDGAGEDGVGGEEAGHGNEQARGVQSDLLEMSVEEMPVRFGCYRFRSPDKWEECEEGMRIGCVFDNPTFDRLSARLSTTATRLKFDKALSEEAEEGLAVYCVTDQLHNPPSCPASSSLTLERRVFVGHRRCR